MSIRNGMHFGVFTPRDPEWIEPGSPEHAAAISPSKVAAILGFSRWESPYSLWRRMRGDIPPQPPKDNFTIGHDFEPAAANRWRHHNTGWRLSPGEVQFVVDPEHFGFPAVCTLDRRAVRGRARKVVEFKTARDLADWGDDFTDDCPPDYAAQVIAQMMFTGFTREPADLLVLGPWFNEHIYRIPYDRTVAAWIVKECRSFYESLSADTPPPLDDSIASYEAVRAEHPDIDADTVTQVDHEQAWRLLQFDADLKANTECLRGAKTRLLDQMGRAQVAMVGDLKIADRRPHHSGSVSLNLNKKALPQLVNEGSTA